MVAKSRIGLRSLLDTWPRISHRKLFAISFRQCKDRRDVSNREVKSFLLDLYALIRMRSQVVVVVVWCVCVCVFLCSATGTGGTGNM